MLFLYIYTVFIHTYSKTPTSQKTESEFLISILISIYNTEPYLEECFNSVINQTLDFETNIQMILVNDGSIDNSEEICLRYQKLFPANIIYVKKENGGLSSARNAGLPFVRGKYINFMDSDDIWDYRALELTADFFNKHYTEVDVVGARVLYFEGKSYPHPLDYKFRSTRVVSLIENYDCIQLQASSSFVKVSAIGNLEFCTDLKVSEDFIFLNEIILRTCRVGLVSEALYHYRQRLAGGSILQLSRRNPTFYNVTPQVCYQYLFDYSTKLYGHIMAFIQYAVMYDLQWRVRDSLNGILEPEQSNQYCNMIRHLLRQIDDTIIWGQKHINERLKIICLSEKHGFDIRNKLTMINNRRRFEIRMTTFD